MVGRRALRVLDAAAYAAVASVASLVVSVLGTFPLGAGWPAVKAWLFIVGWLLVGFGTLKLRPAAAWKRDRATLDEAPDEDDSWLSDGLLPGAGDSTSPSVERDREDDQGERESTLERVVFRLLPERYAVAPDERFSGGTRLFLAGVTVLTISFAMETVFGVAA